jgi:uncharacterized protein
MTKMTEDVFAKFEQLGVETIREMISSGHWPANYLALATSWLQLRDVEEIERKPEHRADPVAVAPRGDDKGQERIDQPKWHNFLWDKPGNIAILFLLVLAVMLLIFVFAAPTPLPASNAPTPLPASNAPTPLPVSNVEQTAAKSTDLNNSPSFDCQKTVDAVHKLICSTPQLSVADRDMAAAYEAVQTSPADTVLRNSQWNWLKTRDNSAADISVLAGLYKDRIDFLLHYHHAVTLRRPRKPKLTNSDASPRTKTEEQMDSNSPHACTHEELLRAHIARINEYLGGPTCTNGP